MRENPFNIIFGVEPESMIPRNEEYQRVINDFESARPVSMGYVITEFNITVAGFGGGLSKRSLSDNETLLRKMLSAAGKMKKRVLITIDEASNTEKIKTFSHSYQAYIGEGLPTSPLPSPFFISKC